MPTTTPPARESKPYMTQVKNMYRHHALEVVLARRGSFLCVETTHDRLPMLLDSFLARERVLPRLKVLEELRRPYDSRIGTRGDTLIRLDSDVLVVRHDVSN
jgi:hypothetical protein